MHSPRSFKEAFDSLNKIEGFDRNAFIAENKDEQAVCSFILSLALIYNDIKNIHLFISVLGASKPEGEMKISKDWGEYNGINFFLHKILISILHETMDVIKNKKNRRVLQHELFEKTIKQISKKSKTSWNLLVEASKNNNSMSKSQNPYLMIRNKIGFHYDNKKIYSGYKKNFTEIKPLMDPMLSRGNQMREKRFYFADAAAETCTDITNYNDFFNDAHDHLDSLNQSLQNIVETFITIRRPGWKQISEGESI